VRQLLRFYLLLEQGKLVSPEASKKMREIFESPDLPADDIKFVPGSESRPITYSTVSVINYNSTPISAINQEQPLMYLSQTRTH
jgi:hypothetical protein